MNALKYILFSRFKTISVLIISAIFSITLLMIRVKINHSNFFLFLIWNLFLAVIPITISIYLLSKPKLNKIQCFIWFCIWLAFLPNAPYIITDLLHLKVSTNTSLWLDILVIGAFALNGLLLFFLTLIDMELLLKQHFKTNSIKIILLAINFLCGFGVFLGRFLRYNSWEIIQNPIVLFNDILNIILQPNLHYEAWLFTILFGVFLNIGFWIYKTLTNAN